MKEFMEADNTSDESFVNILKNEPTIKPLVVISYSIYDEEIHKNAILQAGFDYFSSIKTLNSLESQIEQISIFIRIKQM